MQLLLLSNSTNYNTPYFDWCKHKVADFLTEKQKENIVFIPYAAADFSFDVYTEKLNTALNDVGMKVKGVHEFADSVEAIKSASAIFVGGGNTFCLLKRMQEQGLLAEIQNRVSKGVPYVGWSAGSNVAGPSIRTTNDMPIAEPESFNALGLTKYNINPHYTEKTIPDHGGESRKQRLKEFLAVNTNAEVACLPEGCYIEQQGDEIWYKGSENGILLTVSEQRELHVNSRL